MRGNRRPVDRPVLFQDEMVRQVLAGRKRVTRRVSGWWFSALPGDTLWVRECFKTWKEKTFDEDELDALGVADHPDEVDRSYRFYHSELCNYRATPRVGMRRWLSEPCVGQEEPHRVTFLHESTPESARPALFLGPWRPGIHMPRWTCRLRLRITGVQVERGADTLANGDTVPMPAVDVDEAQIEGFEDRQAFLALWNRLHPSYSGPVARIAFEVL